ncbi:hypothetical protein V6N13_035007 [Hibiscus sabdariffa]
MKKLFELKSILQRRAAHEWRRLLEQPRRLVGLFNRGQLVVFGRLAKGHCLATLFMSRAMVRIYRKSGPLFLARYLKQCLVLVYWYVAGAEKTARPQLSLPVSLTRTGLPRIIPPVYRKAIRRRDMLVVRMVITILSFYRIMKVGAKGWRIVNTKTIYDRSFVPSVGVVIWSNFFQDYAKPLLQRYSPSACDLTLELGFTWRSVYSSTPNATSRIFKNLGASSTGFAALARKLREASSGKRLELTALHTLPVDVNAFVMQQPHDVASWTNVFSAHSLHSVNGPEFRPEGLGWQGRDVIAAGLFGVSLIFTKFWRQHMSGPPEMGRFGLKLEAAGKVRVFAIANPIAQRLLRPLHDWVMTVLSMLPTDGTFHQTQPLDRLKGKRDLYSFDLKAATDLLPRELSVHMLSGLLGEAIGLTWGSIMRHSTFCTPRIPANRESRRRFRFNRGQPLGFYSSWPVFALTHHMIVWAAAERVYPGRSFRDYALLGDDIVIADEQVALEYKRIMEEADGVISMDKSLVSHNGCCEFAKRFIVDNHTDRRRDISPVSSACLILAYSALGASFLNVLECDLVASFRVRGAGYRVLAKADRSRPDKVFDRLSRRWKRHWLSVYSKSGLHPLPLNRWLRFPQDGVINCYEYGMLRWYLIERVKPRDIDENSINELRA